MDAPRTVFYLVPQNKQAAQIVQDPANRDRACRLPHIGSELVLRIGLDQEPKSHAHLVKFGRHPANNDVILNRYFTTKHDQCYFDFNKETGELLLHDISGNGDTKLYDIATVSNNYGTIEEERGQPQIWKAPRQCVVLLGVGRQCIFKIGRAEFRLMPRKTANDVDEEDFARERLEFARRPFPDQTIDSAIRQVFTLDLQSQRLAITLKAASVTTASHQGTWFGTPLEPNRDDRIRYTQLGRLGEGWQGEVHKVVDMYTGAHYACKVLKVKGEVPSWNIFSERDFRARVKREIQLVQALKHDHIVPYIQAQGFESHPNIEIFMPLYEGNLSNLLKSLRREMPESVLATTDLMLRHILAALDFVHTRDPQIIHRDVKPPNILYRRDQFFLTDFGIAKIVDTSNTVIGTELFMAPEVQEKGTHTPKIDIWGLGVTVVECLGGPTAVGEIPPELSNWNQWRETLQGLLERLASKQLAPRFVDMLAMTADKRPTARDLLNIIEPRSHAVFQNLPTDSTATSLGASRTMNEENRATMLSVVPTVLDRRLAAACSQGASQSMRDNGGIRPTNVPPSQVAQRGTTRGGSTNSTRSSNEKKKRRCGHNKPSLNGRNVSPQLLRVSKRTSTRNQPRRSERIQKAVMMEASRIP